VVLAMVLGWLGRQPLVTTGGDDATYILLAQSLRHGAYRDIFLPGAPAHAQYPPGFPLLILAVRTLTLGSLEAVRATNLLLLALTAMLTAAVTRRIASNTLGVASAALVMLNPLLLHHAGWILSDILFVTWTTLALWASQRALSQSSRALWLVAGCTAVAAFFTRSAGITVVLAVVGGLLLQRRWKVAPFVGGVAVALVIAWFTYTHWAAGRTLGWSYQNDLAYVQPRMLLALLRRMLVNAGSYGRLVGSTVYSIPDIPATPIDNAIWCILFAGLAAIGLWQIRQRWPTAVLYALLMTGVLLVYPFVAQRLLVPLIPVFIATLLVGVGVVARRLGVARPDRAVVAIAVVLACVGIVSGIEAAVRGTACRAAAGDACRTEAERAWIAAAEWSKRGLPPDAVVASSKPSTFYLISGRRGIPSRMLFAPRKPEDVLAPRGPVTYVLISDLWNYERASLIQALQPSCARLRPVPHADNRTLIVQVLPGDSTSEEGCHALQNFQDTLGTRPRAPARQ
jgi:4-amino-4-deoxy-L-arabinose transferase-like glycosyltransferase